METREQEGTRARSGAEPSLAAVVHRTRMGRARSTLAQKRWCPWRMDSRDVVWCEGIDSKLSPPCEGLFDPGSGGRYVPLCGAEEHEHLLLGEPELLELGQPLGVRDRRAPIRDTRGRDGDRELWGRKVGDESREGGLLICGQRGGLGRGWRGRVRVLGRQDRRRHRTEWVCVGLSGLD